MNSQKLSEPLHNLIMKSEPALADLHRIPDATGWCPARIIEPVSKLDSLRVLERQVPRLPAAGKPSWSQWCSDAISPVAR